MENLVDATDGVHAAAAMAAHTAAALAAKTRETEAGLNRLGAEVDAAHRAEMEQVMRDLRTCLQGIDEVLQHRLQFFDAIQPIISRGVGWQYASANTPPPDYRKVPRRGNMFKTTNTSMVNTNTENNGMKPGGNKGTSKKRKQCETMEKSKIRVIYEYEFRRGTTVSETARNINAVFGEGSTTKATVGNWFKNFRDGDFSLANEPRGRPKTKVNNNHSRAVVESDPPQSTRELASIFNVSIPTILFI
ncbi:hypothetical protein DMN91_003463 [Ooceraea biroi]|uniref:Mos1 transposase HTH domain-containing protein n=1 Tax=Ooceraea biroi TaxID=2015173 RepID=A0A3L8DS49_OOCBI|nr:hypothetical protein DMN91_003463 [Ooceraea biroi]